MQGVSDFWFVLSKEDHVNLITHTMARLDEFTFLGTADRPAKDLHGHRVVLGLLRTQAIDFLMWLGVDKDGPLQMRSLLPAIMDAAPVEATIVGVDSWDIEGLVSICTHGYEFAFLDVLHPMARDGYEDGETDTFELSGFVHTLHRLSRVLSLPMAIQ